MNLDFFWGMLFAFGICFILFLTKRAYDDIFAAIEKDKEKKDKSDDQEWWKTGGKPPWEQ